MISKQGMLGLTYSVFMCNSGLKSLEVKSAMPSKVDLCWSHLRRHCLRYTGAASSSKCSSSICSWAS